MSAVVSPFSEGPRIELRRDTGPVGYTTGPWIRDRQIARIRGLSRPGQPMAVIDRRDRILGWGLHSETSRIAVRMLSWGEEPPAVDWLRARIVGAIAARAAWRLPDADNTGVRLVGSEGDGLPGLVVDAYDGALVVQIGTAAMAHHQVEIIEVLRERLGGAVHVLRSETAAAREGFAAGAEIEGTPERLTFREHGLSFSVPPPPGQKTGAYFDQRANRSRVAAMLGPSHRMLDVGCHVGGFALHASRAGAEVVALDSSRAALAHARTNAERNGLGNITWVEADMFGALDDPALAGPFDVIVADPPKIAAAKRDLDAARPALRALAQRLARRLRPHGRLVLCSCSHHLGAPHLDEAVGPTFTCVARWGADLDHPVAPGHAQGEYLRVGVYERR